MKNKKWNGNRIVCFSFYVEYISIWNEPKKKSRNREREREWWSRRVYGLVFCLEWLTVDMWEEKQRTIERTNRWTDIFKCLYKRTNDVSRCISMQRKHLFDSSFFLRQKKKQCGVIDFHTKIVFRILI